MVCLPPVEGGNVGVLHPCGSVVLYDACKVVGKMLFLFIIGQFVTASEHWSLRWFSPGLLSRPDLNQGWFRVDDADARFAGVLLNLFIILLTSGNTAAPLEVFFSGILSWTRDLKLFLAVEFRISVITHSGPFWASKSKSASLFRRWWFAVLTISSFRAQGGVRKTD